MSRGHATWWLGTLAVGASALALGGCGRTGLQAPRSFKVDAGSSGPADAVEARDRASAGAGEVPDRDLAARREDVGDAWTMDGAGEGPGANLCGNGVMDPGEECEFGSPGAGEACLPTCRCDPSPVCLATCGNGRIDPGEACDDGNTRGDDGCTVCCQYISPMMMYWLDQCDYQVLVSAKPWMRLYSDCGDGSVEALFPEEECDDGNRLDGDGCSAICRWEPQVPPANCGNGVLDPGEECDDGTNGGGYGNCAVGCRLGARCGDAIVQPEAGEQCDRGEQYNTGGFGGCESNCRFSPHCGDGIVQIDLGEQCDDGDDNQSGYGHCSVCRLGPRCGDGVVQKDSGEQCDDGNLLDGDGCSALCRTER